MKKQGAHLARALFIAITFAVALSACGGAGGGDGGGIAPNSKGKLEVTVSGLSGVDADITVTGPDSYRVNLTETTLLDGLVPGTYELTGQPVAGHVVLDPTPITATVEAGKTVKATVTYEFIGVDITPSAPDVISLSDSATVTVSIERFGSFSGEVRLTPTVPGTFDCFVLGSSCAAEQVVPATEDSISYSFIDDGTTPIGTYEFRINTEHELDGETITQEFVFDIDVAPVVTTTDDATPAEPGMLRFLVADTRAKNETITFLPSVFADVTNIFLTDEVAIEQPLAIVGPLDESDEPLVFLDGNYTVNGLRITAHATVQNLGIQHGVRNLGAGVFVGPFANVTLENTRIIENTASESGGGVYSLGNLIITASDIVSNTAEEHGGGIAMMPGGELEITGSVISYNVVLQSSGGGLYIGSNPSLPVVQANISSTRIEENKAISGGGIMSHGEVMIVNSEISGNESEFYLGTNDFGSGGGMSNHHRMNITDTLVSGNIAAGDAGGLFNDGYVEISQSTFRNNEAGGDGGGIYNGVIDSDKLADGFSAKYATIGTSIIRDNEAGGDGGGIYSVRRLDVVNTHIDENHAGGDGGGIYTVSVPHTATDNNGGQFSFVASTVVNNAALQSGGGIYSDTVYSGDLQGGEPQAMPKSEFTMRNALVYGNSTGLGYVGGGIFLSGLNEKEATIFFTTIMDNTAGNVGGGLYVANRGDITNVGLRYRGNLFLDNTNGPNLRDLHSTGSVMISDGYNSFTNVNSTVGHSDATGDRLHDRSQVAPEPYGEYGGTLIGHNQETMSSVKITPASAVAYKVPIAECVDKEGNPLSSDITAYPRDFGDPANCTIGSFEARD